MSGEHEYEEAPNGNFELAPGQNLIVWLSNKKGEAYKGVSFYIGTGGDLDDDPNEG